MDFQETGNNLKYNALSCQNCDALQDFPEGTGPPRMRFNQPTMYDHMESYCKFKKNAEHNSKTTKAQSEKFTNFIVAHAKSNESITGNENKASKKDSKREEGHSSKRNLGSADSLINISRSPINCPVTECSQAIGITSILSHFLRDHKQSFPVDFQDIVGNRRSVLLFDETIFSYDANICLGVLGYGGKYETEITRPALSGLCRANSFLPEKYSQFHYHLPILIMGCKTTLYALFADEETNAQLPDLEDNTKDILLLWLATVETTKPIHCTITVFDQAMTASRSTIIQIRNLKFSQNPTDFVPNEVNYLMLNRGELNILSKNGEAPIEIEIFIHEFDE